MRKNLRTVLAVSIVTAMALTACGNANDTPGNDATASSSNGSTAGATEEAASNGSGASGKDTLTVAVSSDPASLDPAMQNDQPSQRVMTQIYETLVIQDEESNIQPSLATSWEFIDSANLRMNLKEGVKFHNGEELKASDVKFSIERAIESPQTSSIVEMIEEVVVEDDYTITIVMLEPFASILPHLAHRSISIVSEKAVNEKGESFAQEPVGTGAFQFDLWRAGDRIEMSRFEDYHGVTPSLNKIIFRTVTENANRAIEVETGGVDIAYDILPEDIAKIEASPDAHVSRGSAFSTTYIGFNCEKAPFDNPLVRQAINYALDKSAIVDAVYQGTGAISNGPLNAMVWGSIQDELEPYNYDVEKALDLLAQAGYPDGFSVDLWTNDNIQRRDIAEIVQNQLKPLNIDCTVSVLEWATYLDRTSDGEHDMFILGWSNPTGDADRGLYPCFHSSYHGAPGNRAYYTNLEVDRLLEEGRASTNEEERLAIYAEAQVLIRDDAPWIFLWQLENLNGIRNDVVGFKDHPSGSHYLQNLSFK